MKLIDIHTHGIGGHDTVTTSKEDILKIAAIHGSHGVSEIIPTIYSSDIKTMRKHMAAVKLAMEDQGNSTDRSAHIAGMHLEGPFLNPEKCGALAAPSFLRPDERFLKSLIDGYEDSVRIITIAPELEGASKLITQLSDMGIMASMGHSEATYTEAEAGYHAGARGITHLFNAMRGIHHREPGLAGFGLMHQDVYIEVIADPFHLDQHIVEMIFRVKNPERIIIVSDTVRAAKTEGSAAGITNKNDTLLGGSMTIRESSRRLIELGIDQEVVNRTVSENPARYLNYRG